MVVGKDKWLAECSDEMLAALTVMKLAAQMDSMGAMMAEMMVQLMEQEKEKLLAAQLGLFSVDLMVATSGTFAVV